MCIGHDRYTLNKPEGPEQVSGALVSDGFFRTLGVTPALGRDFFAGEDRPSALRTTILSYAAWKSRFGADPRVLGRTVYLEGESFTIVGVLPRDFHFAPVGRAEFGQRSTVVANSSVTASRFMVWHGCAMEFPLQRPIKM